MTYKVMKKENHQIVNNYPILLPLPRVLRGPPCGGSAKVDADGCDRAEYEASTAVAGILDMGTLALDVGVISTSSSSSQRTLSNCSKSNTPSSKLSFSRLLSQRLKF
jgi:hypothetical protein